MILNTRTFIAVTGAAVFAATLTASNQRPAIRPTASAAAHGPRPVINRTVPRVTPPSAMPAFSPAPTDLELRQARIFLEPLLPLGASTLADNQALADAVTRYAIAAKPFEIEPFVTFLKEHPSSVWRASVQANLGGLLRSSGYYTRALRAWEEAWTLSKDDPSAHGHAIADFSAGQALDMLSTLGYVAGLDRWLERTQAREMTGPAAVHAATAREVRTLIARNPERVIPSGPKALEMLLLWQNQGARTPTRDTPRPVPAIIKEYRPTAAGISLAELRTMAAKVGLTMKAVRRESGAPLVVPAIVHLGFDHFSAVLEEIDGRYRVRDPALGGEVWMTREALDEEMTGAALIAAAQEVPGWHELTDTEAAAIVGHSCPPGLPDPDECPCPEGQPGMPIYSLHPVQASVLLGDTPLGYTPPRGPAVNLQLRYNHREQNQPQTYTFANLGAKWTFNWGAYAEEVPFTWFNQGGQLAFAQPAHVAVHIPQGGVERFQFEDVNGLFERHYRSAAVLVHVSDNPLTYERRHTDGSKEVYSVPAGGVPGTRRVMISAIVDPHGQSLQFTWDAQLRLVAIADALGQVTTLQYESADPLRITSVTDPFSRVARITYDTTGHLASITDVIDLASSFTYGNADFIAGMRTPYGLTTFRAPAMSAENARAVEAIDPLGAVERLEFWWTGAPVPATVPPEEVPAGFESMNSQLDAGTSLHWTKGRNVASVQQAVAFRWLLRSMDWTWDPGWTVGVPFTVQRPGEARTWYAYTGSTTRPSRIARKLPDGTVYDVNTNYNYQDNVTWTKDPVGREMTFTYAPNGIDLLEVRNTTAGRNDLLATYSDYTAGHLARTTTDASGQATQVTYNTAGQLLTVTNAKQEQTVRSYDPDGYLQTLSGPVAGAIVTYTYDGYGRLRSITPAGEATVTTDYDALNRPTRTTYADGTYEELTYDKLDAAARRDRAGRVTRFTYNAVRQLIATRDPAGHVVQQRWCACGVLEALTDGNGNATVWELDTFGRAYRERRADSGIRVEYTFDALGRVKTITDSKLQITTYTYNLDGTIASVGYTNAAVPTPGVTWTYDPAYARVATMVDGTGTTSYTYHPAGQLGAGQLETVDGPLPDDLATYTYDQLGRALSRAVNSVPLTRTYDALGRVEREVNALGEFVYTFDGVSGRVASATYPNNQVSEYTYFPAAQDHRLQAILHRYPGGATLSSFDYAYDALGNITSVRHQTDTTAVTWEYGYDAAQVLTVATKRATDPPATVLQRFAYGYDAAGNRTFEQLDDNVKSWTYDRSNRAQTQNVGGLLRVAGTVNEPAVVSVQGRPASVDASGQFVGTVQVAGGASQFTVSATDASGNTANRTYEVDQAGVSKAFTYDPNGNLIFDGTRTLEWDARNQLVSITTGLHRSEFTYDGLQRRVRVIEKENGAIVSDTRVVWCHSVVCEERGADGITVTRRSFAQGEQVAGGVRFFTTDHLGSINEVVDAAGTLLARYAYDPWGRRTLTAGADVTSAGYTGHRWQSASSLSLTLYRAYDPELGRWISEDPAGRVDGPNLYAYVNDQPLRWTDRLGDQKECCECSVQVKCRPLQGWLGLLADHCYVVVKDSKCKTTYIESGPTGPNGTGQNQAHAGETLHPSNANAPLTWPSRTKKVDCKVVEHMKQAVRNWNDANIQYNPLGPNSNSFVSWLLRDAGIGAWPPILSTPPGWY